MKTLLILLFFAVPCLGREVTIAWDANPPEENVTEYRVYIEDKTAPGKYDILTTVSSTTALIDIPNGLQTVRVTAFNGLESLPSDPLQIPNRPGKPQRLRIER